MIVNFEDLPEVREQHRQERIVLAGGCFDLVHEGHVSGLQYCRNLGDLLIVGISPDSRVRERKGPNRPIRGELSRLALVDALKPVGYTFLFPHAPATGPSATVQSILMLEPDIFADHEENTEKWEPVREMIESLGTKFMYNRSPRPDSTSGIIDKVLVAYGREAAA